MPKMIKETLDWWSRSLIILCLVGVMGCWNTELDEQANFAAELAKLIQEGDIRKAKAQEKLLAPRRAYKQPEAEIEEFKMRIKERASEFGDRLVLTEQDRYDENAPLEGWVYKKYFYPLPPMRESGNCEETQIIMTSCGWCSTSNGASELIALLEADRWRVFRYRPPDTVFSLNHSFSQFGEYTLVRSIKCKEATQ